MLFLCVVTLVQIVLESLPVSSSGHVALITCVYQRFLPSYDIDFVSDDFMHIIHIPTACIIALFFFSTWSFLLINYRRTWPIILKLIGFTVFVDIVTALFFVVIRLQWAPVSIPLYVGFALTSMILFSLRWVLPRRDAKLSLRNALIFGTVQGLALLPGISRFAAVYGTASWLGFDWKKSFAITWMVQWPLIAAASIKSILHFFGNHELASFCTVELGATIMGATILGLLALIVAARLARAEKLWLFSIYMIFPCMLAYWYCN